MKQISALRAILLCLLIFSSSASAETQIELHTAQGNFVGKPIARDNNICWLAAEDGRYSKVEFKSVTAFQKHPKQFREISVTDLRNQLKAEFGKEFEVSSSSPFLVAGPPGRADDYAKLLGRMARSFSRYLSVRKLPAKTLEFPLIVIIFPSRDGFREYGLSDDVKAGSFLQGYYHPHSNRIALFENEVLIPGMEKSEAYKNTSSQTLPEETVSTLIHEGIHQLAFNHGLHSRIGKNPRWIIEGLATMFEADSSMNQSRGKKSSNINMSRLAWFKQFQAKTRDITIADFIADDETQFRRNILNAYSQSWALTYFLAENYPADFSAYLQRVANRDPLDTKYTADERLADFQAVFKEDLPWLEVKFLRFIDGLEVVEQ